MLRFMFFMRIQKGLTLEKHLQQQAFICQAVVSGRRMHWCLEEVHTSGSTSLASMVGRRVVSITGIRIESRLPFGSMIARRQVKTILL